MDKDIKIKNKYIYLKPLDIIIVFFSHWNILKHITGVSTFLSTYHQIIKLQNTYSFLPGKKCCRTAQQDCFARINSKLMQQFFLMVSLREINNLKIALSSSDLPLSSIILSYRIYSPVFQKRPQFIDEKKTTNVENYC